MKAGLYGEERECLLCRSPYVHRHHIFPGTGRRDVSEREGCWVYLCGPHHNLSDQGVHFDRDLDLRLRRDCQLRWEEREGVGHDEFIKVFGESYVTDDEEAFRFQRRH